MQDKLNTIKKQVLEQMGKIKDLPSLESLEIKYLGRKGELTAILRGLKDLSLADKKKFGALANQVKIELQEIIEQAKQSLAGSQEQETDFDISQGFKIEALGTIHPLSQMQYELEDIFTSMGFMILDGPQLESDFFNFEALNIPADHPARDMQDTFYIKSKGKTPLVMRTHTSPVQVRAMKEHGAPLKAIVPGRVFRNEATDASHEDTFYQLEGLMVDKDISIANLIATMKILLSRIFKKEVKVRLRPGFFPFVEPGFELDINCLICQGQGCSVCKQTGWLELMPCGMVHPHVLRAGGVDDKEYSGFAFGLGLTRLVMMKYQISDIRLLINGDLRFLKQF